MKRMKDVGITLASREAAVSATVRRVRNREATTAAVD